MIGAVTPDVGRASDELAPRWLPFRRIAASSIGVSVEHQFTVFGASGAVVFMLLNGLLLARLGPASTRRA